MNLIFLGAPGAGKGTYAFKLKTLKNLAHISTGEILRESFDHPEHGSMIKEIMSTGKLIPDDVIISLLSERLKKDDCQNGFILDGFPRTLKQAEALEEKNVKIDKVVLLDVNEVTVLDRLSGRFTCKGCSKLYNLNTGIEPQKKGVCDECSGELFQRDDDKEETIKNRLSVYEEKTKSLISFYEERNLIVKHDSNREVETVFGELVNALYDR